VPGKKSKLERTRLLDVNVLLALAWPNPSLPPQVPGLVCTPRLDWVEYLPSHRDRIRAAVCQPRRRFLPSATLGVLAFAGNHEAARTTFISL
jgi:hypothetical protein